MKQPDIVKSKLGKKLVFLILLAGVVPLFVFVVPLYFQSYNFLHREAQNSMVKYTKFTTDQLFLSLKQAEDRLKTYAGTPNVPDPDSLTLFTRVKRTQSIEELKKFLPETPEFWEKLEAIRSEKETGVLMTPPYNLDQVTTVGLILRESGGSFVFGELDPVKLWEPLRGSLYNSGDLVMVIDSDNRFIASSKTIPFEPLESIAGKFSGSIARGERDHGESHLEGLGDVLWVSKNLWLEGAFGSGNWYVLIFRKSEQIGTLSRQLMQSLGVWLGLALSGLILLSFRFARRIYYPIREISEATNQIAQGDWSIDITIDRDDELGQLGENFLQMKEKIKEINQQLEYDATHDQLTGLPNRTLVEERIQHNINRSKRHSDYSFAVIYFDLNNFKEINDIHGHNEGDNLLKIVSKRIENRLRSTDIFGRIGGDEFIMVLDSIENIDQVVNVAQDIEKIMSKPIAIAGEEVEMTLSMGIVKFDHRYDHAEEMLQDADSAMYRNKEDQNEASFAIFGRLMKHEYESHLDMEMDLKQAIDRNEFQLTFQPVFDLNSREIIGAETLLHWDHPEKGQIDPGQFLPVAREIGYVEDITKWLVENTAKMMVRTNEVQPKDTIWFGVNLSSSQIQYGNSYQLIRDVLRKNELQPGYLKVELEETLFYSNTGGYKSRMEQFRDKGIDVIMDHSRLGHSSLYRLKDLAVDWLKIAPKFVSDLYDNEEYQTIVAAAVSMSSQFGINVIAEGVEEEKEVSLLKELGCRYIQGNHLGVALDADEFFKQYFNSSTK